MRYRHNFLNQIIKCGNKIALKITKTWESFNACKGEGNIKKGLFLRSIKLDSIIVFTTILNERNRILMPRNWYKPEMRIVHRLLRKF